MIMYDEADKTGRYHNLYYDIIQKLAQKSYTGEQNWEILS